MSSGLSEIHTVSELSAFSTPHKARRRGADEMSGISGMSSLAGSRPPSPAPATRLVHRRVEPASDTYPGRLKQLDDQQEADREMIGYLREALIELQGKVSSHDSALAKLRRNDDVAAKNVLGIEAVLPDGELIRLGGPAADRPGLDLLGVLIGSEGTLAIVTKATLRLLRCPEAVWTVLAAFTSTDAAGGVVSDIIAAGIVPAAVEMMDRLTIEAAEAAVKPGFPEADAILIVELDGPRVEVDEQMRLVETICQRHGCDALQVARDEDERQRFWKGRKAAFAAMGHVAPNYYVQDGVIPRTRLPEVLGRIRRLEADSGLRIGNVFHAGDGNLHPLICYDANIDGQAALAKRVATEILTYCLEAGGSLTGEHGVGADKAKQMPKMFGVDDLDTMQLVRCAFDPRGLCNPGKIFPTPRLCGEVPGPYRQHPAERAGLAERF